jgi:hypothetical protein
MAWTDIKGLKEVFFAFQTFLKGKVKQEEVLSIIF